MNRQLDEYEMETIAAIRGIGSPRLNALTDDEIAALYTEWSGITACAGWLISSSPEPFIAWATTAPYDR